ncbi:hypothetical protein [Alkalibacillus haloalkaliphilus]|uniref:hypothetical protein n=1 Tax=Alkalibacillus haloalkaliphilus TaxID=94136 RepID=UPI0003750D12
MRRVARIEQRVQEASKLGFKRIILPRKNLGSFTPPDGVELVGVDSVQEALKEGLGE